jgi:hypothetical protein
MAEGRCNCASIKVTIPGGMPKESAICYWYNSLPPPLHRTPLNNNSANCRRAGGSIGSIIYVIDKTDVEINDTKNTLKSYTDSDTKSGNTIIRQFCSDCGSYVDSKAGHCNADVGRPIASLTTDGGSKMFLKGGLFEQIPKATYKSFEQDEPEWVKIG